MITVKIKKLDESAILPKKATDGSAGADIYTTIKESVTLEPNGRYKFPTGLSIALPSSDYAAFIFSRSGLSVKHGLTLANCVGVIDSDYRGEITVNLVNRSNEPYTVEPGERIAQLVVMPVAGVEFSECSELDSTVRGEGGFGSSGRK